MDPINPKSEIKSFQALEEWNEAAQFFLGKKEKNFTDMIKLKQSLQSVNILKQAILYAQLGWRKEMAMRRCEDSNL